MNISDLKGPPSLEVVNLVLKKLTKGEKLISLAIGEPMYETPKEIIDVAYESMKKGETRCDSLEQSFGLLNSSLILFIMERPL